MSAPTRRKLVLSGGPIRLDLLTNPFGPSVRVSEALAAEPDLHLHDPRREQALRAQIGAMIGAPAAWITLVNGIDEALWTLFIAQRAHGPVALFPPTDPGHERIARLAGADVVCIERSPRWQAEIDPAEPGALTSSTLALVQSPNDPTGGLLDATNAVRLSRACRLVAIDERHGEYTGRTHVPLVREFDNVVVLQSFETWAGLSGLPFAWIVARPPVTAALAASRPAPRVATAAAIAALATLDDITYVRATAMRIRDEKARLYRTLRKLNIVRPLPSWANFLLVHVERGDASALQMELARRDVFVYRPEHPALDGYLRIAAGTPETTRLLRDALIDIARDIEA